jgi:acyl carrier protein
MLSQERVGTVAENEAKKKIRSFLSRYLRETDFEDDRDLFASGLLNSLFAMELVLFVEEDFGILVENDDLDLANFCSIDAIWRFIERKKGDPSVAQTKNDA